MRDAFVETTGKLLAEDPRTALVLADISAADFAAAGKEHPDRVVNVGIREQLMISVAGGLALAGLRPIAHSYAPFLVERSYEQIKLDLGHQEVGAVLVSVGASYDASTAGRTHLSPADVALIDTLDGWRVHVPGHPDEVGPVLRTAAAEDGLVYIRLSTQANSVPYADAHHPEQLINLREGRRATVVVIGPLADQVLAATEGLDVTVAYTNTPRPFDTAGLRSRVISAAARDVVLVEPYLAGTSARIVAEALQDIPHRLLALGVGRADLHAYGTPLDHEARHGLDPAGLRRSITAFLNA